VSCNQKESLVGEPALNPLANSSHFRGMVHPDKVLGRDLRLAAEPVPETHDGHALAGYCDWVFKGTPFVFISQPH
jgi:hypothetical protein